MTQPWAMQLQEPQRFETADLLSRLNERNWRRHGKRQREAMRQTLRRLGELERPLVNLRTGNVVDGEMRIRLTAERKQEMVVCDVIDVSEEHERIILATLDRLAEDAGIDAGGIDNLWAAITRHEEYIADVAPPALVPPSLPDALRPSFHTAVPPTEDDWDDEDEGLSIEDYDCVWVRAPAGSVAEERVAAWLEGLRERWPGLVVDTGRR